MSASVCANTDTSAYSDIFILIPAYKPGKEFPELVSRLRAEGFANILAVDDGSGSEYSDIFSLAEKNGAVICSYAENRGKGGALKYGIEQILARGEYAVLTADCDGQHDTGSIKKTADMYKSSPDSLILGSRAFDRDVPARSALGNGITRAVFFLSTGVHVRDTQTGLRAFSPALAHRFLTLEGNRYEYEMNMLLCCASSGIKIKEVTIATIYLNSNKGSHFSSLRDSYLIYKHIIKFSLSSFICFIIDYVLVLALKSILSAHAPCLSESLSLLIAVGSARAVSSLVNFFINQRVVFGKSSRGAVFKYYLLVLFIAAANYGLLYLLSSVAGIPLAVAKIIVELLLFAVSYFTQKRFIFNGSK